MNRGAQSRNAPEVMVTAVVELEARAGNEIRPDAATHPAKVSTLHSKQPPAPRDALELVFSPVYELDARARHQVDHGP